jgi:hypothetical protein
MWARWKVVAHLIGNFQARIILTLFYFVVLPPFALGLRLFADPFRQREDSTAWTDRVSPEDDRVTRARRQF